MRVPAVEDIVVPAKRRLSRIRSANRDFDRFLDTLDYVPRSIEEPVGENDFVICGSPRSGTTLLAAQLFQLPDIVTVVEPWIGLRESPATSFREIRRGLAEGELRHGRLDIDALTTERRVRWTDLETTTRLGRVGEETMVGIKWPAWWQYLDRLPEARFIVCVREPGEVISSYQRSGGSLREGLDYPARMNAEFNRSLRRRTRSLAQRRSLLYQSINEAVLRHEGRDSVFFLQYERWFSEPDSLRSDLSTFLRVNLGPWPIDIAPQARDRTTIAEPVMSDSLHEVATRLGYGSS